jgi:hypothetical protein
MRLRLAGRSGREKGGGGVEGRKPKRECERRLVQYESRRILLRLRGATMAGQM